MKQVEPSNFRKYIQKTYDLDERYSLILELAKDGMCNKDIADLLNVSAKCVNAYYMAHMYKVLGIVGLRSKRVQLIQMCSKMPYDRG